MKINNRSDKPAQTILAYVIFLGVVIAAFSGIMWQIRHKQQASYKQAADVFGEGRQLVSNSTLHTTGGVPFAFPVLPPGTSATVTPPGVPLPTCNMEAVTALTAVAEAKRVLARASGEILGDAQKAASTALVEEHKAHALSFCADKARDIARIRADEAHTACADCEEDCEDICAYAVILEADAVRLAEIAVALKADWDAKILIRQGLDAQVVGKETLAAADQQAADDAASIAQIAHEDCFGLPHELPPVEPPGEPDPVTAFTDPICEPPPLPPHPPSAACFLKGTKVTLSDGASKPIEKVKNGDMVFGYDGKQVKAAKVVKVLFHPKTKGYRIISTEDGQQINVTDIHRLFNGKAYVVASRFKVGEALFLLKDKKLKAVKIKSIEIKDSINDVYNLKIDKLHNYFAEGILCHNEKPSDPE